jgi:hypothetical protein
MDGIDVGAGVLTDIATGGADIFSVAGETVSNWIVVLLTLGAIALGVALVKRIFSKAGGTHRGR